MGHKENPRTYIADLPVSCLCFWSWSIQDIFRLGGCGGAGVSVVKGCRSIQQAAARSKGVAGLQVREEQPIRASMLLLPFVATGRNIDIDTPFLVVPINDFRPWSVPYRSLAHAGLQQIRTNRLVPRLVWSVCSMFSMVAGQRWMSSMFGVVGGHGYYVSCYLLFIRHSPLSF